MTRETKIGLLVGLAFIIVIGILLTDHLSSSTEAPQAQLPQAGRDVRSTVQSPGSAQAPIASNVQAPVVQLQHQVPTPRELQQPTAPSEVIKIGGASSLQTQTQAPVSQAQNPITAPPVTYVSNTEPQRPAQQPEQQAQVPVRLTQTPQAEITQSYGDAPDSAIARIAAQHGVAVVSLNGSAQNGGNASASSGSKEYTAEPGDSLSRIAQKFLGSGGKASQDAIIKANPSLQANPDLIVAGRTYKIPAAVATATQQPQQPAQLPVTLTTPASIQTPTNRTSSSTENWYTVKPGDTLWKIASEQLGNPGAVNAIKELNKETLNGGDRINADMKLRLPGKSVAQAN